MGYIEFLRQFTDYEPITTFWNDFSIAERFGEDEIKSTFDHAFKEWKHDYKYLTELVMVLNHKIWQHYEIPGHKRIAELYDSLWKSADEYACKHLEGAELEYFYKTTD